ncbi:hypothetical protein LWI28_010245 [Acer negundo]|uniref:non-specific serine/threonine protein kinase n=1 Tax=Acer negundo TaxID=4023 RepID=A0AAD5NPX2_ACENE|nr:hypothetical protein LWI28_010245 [Acer negundo]
MNNKHVFPTLTLHLVITISFFLIVVPVSHCQDVDDDRYSNCTIPYPYRCGSSELNISYPFWGDNRPRNCCHEVFEIKCEENEYHFIEFGTQKFRVLSINYSHPTMTIARDDLWNGYCPGIVSQHTFIDPLLFKSYSPNVRELSFFHECQEQTYPHNSNYFNCSLPDKVISVFYNVSDLPLSNLSSTCKAEIKIPVLLAALDDLCRTRNLGEVLNKGFEVEYNANETFCLPCINSDGKCEPNHSNPGQFECLCGDACHVIGMFMFLSYIVFYVCFKYNSRYVVQVSYGLSNLGI